MSEYDEIRLETPGGTVVMYLAPNATVQPVYQNDLHSVARPRGDAPVSRDMQIWSTEITLQGELEDSDALPNDHEDALRGLGFSGTVTAREQVRRMIQYIVASDGGPFVLIDGQDEYRASDSDAVDYQSGVFPTVQVSEFRPPSDAGMSRYSYTLKLQVGVER